MGVIETFGGANRAIWGLFWDVVVAWGNLEAFRAFLGYLGAIGAIWGLPGILWYLWAHYFYLGDILGLFRLTRARVFQGYSGAMRQRWARLAFKTDKQCQDTLILIMIY